MDNVCSRNNSVNLVIRNDRLTVWDDLFLYATNLNGNWHLSREIFNNYLIPTAQEKPVMFANWVDDMVKVSGIKIKQKQLYTKSLNHLKKCHKPEELPNIQQILVNLLNSGLNEPTIAQNALEHIKENN